MEERNKRGKLVIRGKCMGWENCVLWAGLVREIFSYIFIKKTV